MFFSWISQAQSIKSLGLEFCAFLNLVGLDLVARLYYFFLMKNCQLQIMGFLDRY